MGNGAWGMGKIFQCPMPQVGGRLSISTPLAGWSFPPTSNKCRLGGTNANNVP
ncbi:MAG: hypothetical protein V7L23_12700 [Nostoc sp.]|uniref:hypothetical protein n=1 Tax=Nostoc sp. TaxID=1180 RepID=UPI002FF016A9